MPTEDSRGDGNDLNKSADKEINAGNADGSNVPANALPISTAPIIDQSNQEKAFNETSTHQDSSAKEEKSSAASEFNQPTMWLGTEDKT